MILTELVPTNCIRHYSDQGIKIRQIETDTLWDDAIDILPCAFTYEETDIPVELPEPTLEELFEIIIGNEATQES